LWDTASGSSFGQEAGFEQWKDSVAKPQLVGSLLQLVAQYQRRQALANADSAKEGSATSTTAAAVAAAKAVGASARSSALADYPDVDGWSETSLLAYDSNHPNAPYFGDNSLLAVRKWLLEWRRNLLTQKELQREWGERSSLTAAQPRDLDSYTAGVQQVRETR
jgi:hypothetical protein